MISIHGHFDSKPILGQTDTGGQIIYILNLVSTLSSMGFQIDIFTRWFDINKKQIEYIPNTNNKSRIIRVKCGPMRFIQKELLYDYLPEYSKNMIKYINNNNLSYDLFHGHYVDGGIVTLAVSKYFQKASFFTSHSLGIWKKNLMGGNPEEMENKYKFKRRISEENQIFRNINAQITTTTVQKQKIKELMKYENNNIVTIPCGVNMNYFKPKLKQNDIDLLSQKLNKKKYIFCLSRIDTNKGHDLLLDAFKIVLKYISNIHLIIGGGSKYPSLIEISIINKMKLFIKQNNMENNVKYIGYILQNNLLSYYQECEFFVMPSLFEPFGITALEAMACRKCVVATKNGGIKSIITHQVNGLLVNTSDSNEFATNIIKLCKDNAFKQKLEENAYKTVYNDYRWEIIANKHISMYNNFYNNYN